MRKFFATIVLLFIVIFFNFSNVLALTTIYEAKEEERISPGAVLNEYKIFTDKGWLKVNIIEVDLTDNNTEVGVLNSENGLNTFQTVFQMANKDNIIAAINGDFFNGNSKNGNTIGLSISNGKLLTSTYYENENKDTFGSFILDEDNNAWIDYFTEKIEFISTRGGETLEIGEYNKLFLNYDKAIVYTRDWGDKLKEIVTEMPVTVIVVEDDKIKDIITTGEEVEIPEDGYVVVGFDKVATYMAENFEKRKKVKLNIETELDIDEIKVAISGGAVLVNEGKIPEFFSSNISGSNPRTAIGLSKDEETLYLITVDGRQKDSIGMTQTELAEFLIEKNIYTALNLDGGGSTTMLARRPGRKIISTINSPSNGTLRMVTNALGIYNTEKSGKLSKIKLELEEENVFVNSTRELKVYGYDKYYNPIEIDSSEIEWFVDGVNVTIKDNTIITGDEFGTATLTAKIGKAEGTISIDVLSAPNEINIFPKKKTISLGESVEYEIEAKNKNGYYASMLNDEFEWNVISGDGKFVEGTYIPASTGIHIVSVSAGNATSYALVTVGKQIENRVIEGFENKNFRFVSYPEVVSGEATITSQKCFEGKSAARLDYDFTSTDATRAAYVRFEEEIKIPEETISIKLSVYSKENLNDFIKFKLIDAKGVAKLVMVSKGISGDCWTDISYELTNIALPATLTDIYVAQDDMNIKNKGIVYFDNLVISKDTELDALNQSLPQDIKGIDTACKATNASGDIIKIMVYDEIKNPVILLDKLVNNKVTQIMNQEANVTLLFNEVGEKISEDIDTNIITAGKYKKEEYGNTTIISLDVSNGGIRTTDYTEWLEVQKDIENTESENVFIIMNGSLDDFTDKKERKLFIDVLCELKRTTEKNIWVIHEGEHTTYSMERGIKYLVIGNDGVDKTDPKSVAEDMKYIMITINGTKLSYEIKNVF